MYVTKSINIICENGECPKDFTEVTMIVSKKKPQVTKCSDHSTINLIAHTTKIVAKILRRRIENKIWGCNRRRKNLDLEEKKELRFQLDVENSIRTNLGDR